MKCTNCGAALPADGAPCPHCGYIQPPKIDEKETRSLDLLFSGLVVLAIVLVVILMILTRISG